MLYDTYVDNVRKILCQPSKTTLPSCIRTLMHGFKQFGDEGVYEIVSPLDNVVLKGSGIVQISFKDQKRNTTVHHDVHTAVLLNALYPKELVKIIRQEKQTLSIGQNYGYELGKTAKQDFHPDLSSKVLSEGEYVGIKQDLYRLPSQFLSILSLYFGVKKKNFWTRCKHLTSQGKLSQKNSDLLCSIMDEIVRLRFEAQLYYGEENEKYYLNVDKEAIGNRLVANPEQRKRIKRIYQLVYPLHSILSFFIQTRLNEQALRLDTIFKPYDFVEEGKRYLNKQDLEIAIECFKKELALEPDQSEALLLLRSYEKLFQAQSKQQKYINERVEFYKKNYKELDKFFNEFFLLNQTLNFMNSVPYFNLNLKRLKPFLDTLFSLLAAHIDSSILNKETDLAIRILSLKNQLPVSLELKIYLDLGTFYSELQQLGEAEAMLQKALSFHEKHFSKHKSLVSICIELGRGNKNLNRLDEAKQFYKRAIEEKGNLKQADVEQLYIYDGLLILAFLEKDFKQAVLCMGEIARMTKELPKGTNKEFFQKVMALTETLCEDNLWDELLTLIEKIKIYFPMESEVFIDKAVTKAFACDKEVLRPYLLRLVKVFAIESSIMKETYLFYLNLAGLLCNHKMHKESLQLIQEGIELGFPRHVFLWVRMACFYATGEIEKAIVEGEEQLDHCKCANLLVRCQI